jgi:hypothetical protein
MHPWALPDTRCRGGISKELSRGKVAIEDGKNKGKHHLLDFDSRDVRGGRNKLEAQMHQVHIANAVKLDPINIVPIGTLGSSDVEDELVPGEELVIMKEIVDVKNRQIKREALHIDR